MYLGGRTVARFILVTFGFLGWAFYELSGGSDFDGEALRLSRIETQDLSPVAPEKARTLLASVDTSQAQQSDDVTRSALNLTTTKNIITPKPTVVATQAVATATSANVVEASLVTGEAFIDDLTAEPTIILPSLVAGLNPSAVQPLQEVNDSDIRSVTGNRVNVRGGPGKDYSVVNSLTRGTEVEVLQDPGDGWVKLRPVDGGPVGWMADFLLTQG